MQERHTKISYEQIKNLKTEVFRGASGSRSGPVIDFGALRIPCNGSSEGVAFLTVVIIDKLYPI